MSTPLESATRRVIRIGGVSKAELLSRLDAAAVQLNAHARSLFAHPGFTVLPAPTHVETVELSVADLGLPSGGLFAEVLERAAAVGLAACPLELGPHLRLQYLDQPDNPHGSLASHGHAPPGSLTVISLPVSEEEDTPRGFYLRRVSGSPWLRGYRASDDHPWSPGDRIVLAAPGGAP